MATATEVRERPILFSGPMVRAILDGRKTQTRRVIRSPEKYTGIRECGFCCPHGQPGDRLWVRETWIVGHPAGEEGQWSVLRPTGHTDRDGRVFYRATFKEPDPNEAGRMIWRPSIFMPRWASRLTLEITDVRVERLQEITREDVRAEGVPDTYGEGADQRFPEMEPHVWDNMTWREQWAYCWDSINAKRDHGWDANPWVWVIGFNLVPPHGATA
jgi:hypothetical protein